MEILIGADPEVFVRDKTTGKFVSGYGMIPGTKESPHFVENGAVQVDGMALEYNIVPASTMKEFVNNNNSVFKQLNKMVTAQDKNLELVAVPVADFGKEYMDAQPKEATLLGCTPDYNAWTGQVNVKPDGDVPFRTASGHIHIGWTKNMNPLDPGHFEACCMLTKQLDFSLYVASLIWDDDRIRASLYGKPGAFRPKPYGVEYRVLSNAWLNDQRIMKDVFNIVKFATEDLLKGDRYYEEYDQEFIDSVSSKPFDEIWSRIRIPKGISPVLNERAINKFTESVKNNPPKSFKLSTLDDNHTFDSVMWHATFSDFIYTNSTGNS